MLSSIYPLSFIVSLAALTGWYYYRDNGQRGSFFSKIFLVAIAVFGVSWLLGEGTMGYKVGILSRELLILAIIPLLLSIFRKTKAGYLILLLLTLAALKYFYFDHLQSTFPQQKPSAKVPAKETLSSSENLGLDPEAELLVEIKDLHKIAEIQQVLDRFGLTAVPAFQLKDESATDLDDYFAINVPSKWEHDLASVKQALDETGLVEWLEENERMAISPIETELQRTLPSLGKKYGLNDPGLDHLWGFEAMNVAGLYESLKGLKPQKVALIAILDTGVDGNHEDLKANFISTQSKYDSDKAGHGTHCAGIAAAVSNNGKGIASFSQTNNFVKMTSIKVLSDGGFGTQQMIINGILEAADQKADVISLSLGGPSSQTRQRAYEKAVKYANDKGAIVVVAAGNSNRNAREFTPANVPGVIAVSAVDTLLNKASFSNFVQDLDMGIAAPGVKIYSTFPNNQYQALNGTSMATPYVSGLIGLMKSLSPELSTQDAYRILNESGTATRSQTQTGKLIQPAEALKRIPKAG